MWNWLHSIKYVLSPKLGFCQWLSAMRSSKCVWYHAQQWGFILASACHLMPHFCSFHHGEAFILEDVDVRCQQFDGGVWCSEMLSLPLILFLKAEASKWAEILFYTSVPPRWGAESEDGTTQVVKPYRLNAFEMRRLWNCNVSIRRMAITQSTRRRAELHYSARCICHNVNPSRLGSSRYASLHGPGDPLGAPLWLCPLTRRHFPALSSHLKTPPGAIWLPFSVATWHLQGYGHALVWSNLHDGCQLPSACPD